ncbi:MAG TPA: sigma-70 family RNA polymerase sigma factor [Candidatus Limnocylindrales bacterium]|nr:sigma-70 family RNA polymerase sigma factor [Candidatus Limnocylindrales bacterium]
MTTAELNLEAFRTELNGYCYRMLGSSFEAEDAVQETMVRAWKALDRFEGRSALRSWLYRIATNVCLDMLGSAQRRARPMDLGGPGSKASGLDDLGQMPEMVWLGPAPDLKVLPDEAAVAKESIRLAFVAALQHLPPKQRAVLILREVLAWSAQEVAELLDTSVASVNSALQRARATMAETDVKTDIHKPMDEEQKKLLVRYVDAFERYDMAALAALLHEDATLSMPPLSLWFRGFDDISNWMTGIGNGCVGSRLIPIVANGHPAFGQYRTTGPWALIVLEISAGRIKGINNFLDVDRLFPLFGLPPQLPN